MSAFAVISGCVGAAAFSMLAGLIAITPSDRPVGRFLVAASCASAVWFAAVAAQQHLELSGWLVSTGVYQLEIVRNTLWFLFIGILLAGARENVYRRRLYTGLAAIAVTLLVSAVLGGAPALARSALDADQLQIRKLHFTLALALALAGLVLTEQIFRNTSRDSRWGLKHLCLGVGLIFAFDFYLYADAVLFNRLDATIWSSRGFVNALAVPMIAISVARNREWDLDIFVSRHVVFHGVTLVAAGGYLLAMAATGYYIQVFGGEWGRALKFVFFSAAVLVLLSLFFSLQLRSRLRVFLARHFYRNKYEYGEEWLKFTNALSRAALDPASLNTTILTTVADIVDSPGGIICQKLPSGSFAVARTLSMYDSCQVEIPASSPFIAALQESAAVWDISAGSSLEESQRALVPERLSGLPRTAFIVPIVYRAEMLAFLVLATPRTNQRLDEEDRALLATVGRQAASYLALLRATDALSEARQFETFNRLSAFLVHDLKNVVAQLSLITRNAERHGDNPEFVADAFNTVGDAVSKVNRMLANLRQMHQEVATGEIVDLLALVREAAARKADSLPRPTVVAVGQDPIRVSGARDRLLSVVEHLLQNAIEATAPDGSVEVDLITRRNEVRLTITDTGCGMDRAFINNRLFKPFDTTKGKSGMGIGAYESRHVISSMGGELQVESEPGLGTCFTIVLPLDGQTGTDATPVALVRH